LEPKIR